jgi:hypothetical protein
MFRSKTTFLPPPPLVFACALALGCAGGGPCTGSIGGSSGDPGSGGSGGDGSNIVITAPPLNLPPESACMTGSPGPRLLRRLSAPELTATIQDLFGDATAPVATVFNDPPVLGFTVDANALLVQGLGAQQLMDNAEQVAHWAVANHLADLAPCGSPDVACRQDFIRSFGRRAFRAPLTDARVAAYDALFAAESTFQDGVEAVVTAMLQSPYFVYRSELGAPGAAPRGPEVPLTPYETAAALSYLLTGSAPDAQLSAAADANALSSPDQIDQQAQRLLADPRSQDMVMRFATGWLGVDRLYTTVKDDTVYMLTDAMRADMMAETRGLVVDTFNSGGGVTALLTADHTFLTAALAGYYGLDATGLGTSPLRVMLPAGGARDPGILAHASLLTGYATAGTSSPTQRGKLVRTRVLCQTLPPMPNNLDTKLKPPTQAETTRAHYLEHSQQEPCASCHKLMDPVGFGFEHYDGFGRHRDQDNGFPVDATGTILGMNGEADVSFNGLTDMESQLVASPDVQRCLVRYWSYFAYGSASWPEDACTYQAVSNDAAGGQSGLRAVLLGIIHAPHFTRRAVDP